jgi:hypothetical protein
LPANSTKNGAFRNPGYQHNVLLKNLKLNTKYYYKFGTESNAIKEISETFSFISSPGIGSEESIHFVVFGDMGVKTPFNHSKFWVC